MGANRSRYHQPLLDVPVGGFPRTHCEAFVSLLFVYAGTALTLWLKSNY